LRHSRACSRKGSIALLHRDGVDDALALRALEPGLDDLPLRGVDHQRHAADVGLAGDEVEETIHGADAVDHALVHVDVDDLLAPASTCWRATVRAVG
jgi:hypothetical protein